MGDSDDGLAGDKQWARKYILDPLTCPEPSEECGPGTSFRGPLQRSTSVQPRRRSRSRSDRTNSVRRSEDTSERSHRRSSSKGRSSSSSNSGHHHHHQRSKSSQQQHQQYNKKYPPSASSSRGKGSRSANPPQTQWTQGTILSRESSSDQGLEGNMAANTRTSPPADTAGGLSRSGSLSARYPGDMSHRPLDMIKKDHKSAGRPQKVRSHRRNQPSDSIDSLDLSGLVPYHHDGPFDASIASRNANKRYSPLDALKDSNREALRATPQEHVIDSLTRHVPLQGTATIPPGSKDIAGRTMNYTEGADLMRESDAPGGAYKRYDFIQYHDDDLKGKGEPSYTIERDRKDQKAQLRKYNGSSHHGSRSAVSDDMAYEMRPRNGAGQRSHASSTQSRHRSVSDLPNSPSYTNRPLPPLPDGSSSNVDTHPSRNGGAGRKFAEGLKRRFGSFRRRYDD